MFIFWRVIGVLFVLSGLLALIINPVIGIIMILGGVFCFFCISKMYKNKTLKTILDETVEQPTKKEEQPKLKPQFGQVLYSERVIPDDSPEAKEIIERQNKREEEKRKRIENVPKDFIPFSMDIDNALPIPNRGTMVEGKISIGSIRLNDKVVLAPSYSTKTLTVVQIEKNLISVNEAEAGDAVKLFLDNVKKDDLVFFKDGTLIKKGQEEWEEAKEEEWQKLREAYKSAKKEKDYQKIIESANSLIKLDTEAKFIGVLVPSLEKEIANAYLKLDQKDKAIMFFEAAISGYRAEHEKDKAQQPEIWLKDIESLEKKVLKLKSELK